MLLNIADAKSHGNSPSDTSARYCMRMDRGRRLRQLINERFDGSNVDLAARINKKPAQISQWLTGHRKMSETSARQIESKLKLPPLWFDVDSEQDAVCEPKNWKPPPFIDAPPRKPILDERIKVLVELADRADNIRPDKRDHILDLIRSLFITKEFRVGCAETILNMLKLYEESCPHPQEDRL